MRKILIIHGHPDAGGDHYGDALVKRYAEGAESAGHAVRHHRINELELPLLASASEWRDQPAPEAARKAQELVQWADHLVWLYPLWMGDMPALLKCWIEQVFRPGFAFSDARQGMPQKLLRGRSARVVVTMGMPGWFYRIVYRAHSVRSLCRNVLRFSGIRPVRLSLIGMVEGSQKHRDRWLTRMQRLGAAAR